MGASPGLRGMREELFGMRRSVGGVKGVHGMRGGGAAPNGVGPDDVASYEVGRIPKRENDLLNL